jgi:hypothetical protein
LTTVTVDGITFVVGEGELTATHLQGGIFVGTLQDVVVVILKPGREEWSVVEIYSKMQFSHPFWWIGGWYPNGWPLFLVAPGDDELLSLLPICILLLIIWLLLLMQDGRRLLLLSLLFVVPMLSFTSLGDSVLSTPV